MKRITVVISRANAFGGVQKVNEILLNRLAESGKYEVELLSVFKDSETLYLNLNKNIRVHYLFGKSFDVRKHFLKFVLGVKKFLKDAEKIDLLIVSPVGYALPFAFAVPSSLPAIFWDHQGFFHGRRFGLDWFGRRVACRKKNFCAVCLTKRSLSQYRNTLGNNIKVRQIYNPITELPTSCDYNPNAKKIVSCGRFTGQKGFDLLVEIAKKFFEKGHGDWQWHIYGDGPMFSQIAREISNNKLENNVLLKGYCKNMQAVYKDYSIFALSSRHEGFPMAFLEALSEGLPSVAFDCDTGPSELVDEGKSGFLIKCFDLDDFAQKLSLLASKADLLEFSKNAKALSEKFSQDIFLSEWNKLIESVLNGD